MSHSAFNKYFDGSWVVCCGAHEEVLLSYVELSQVFRNCFIFITCYVFLREILIRNTHPTSAASPVKDVPTS